MSKNSRKNAHQDGPDDRPDITIDEDQLEKVKEILHLFARCVSQIKIFSLEHTAFKKLFDEFWEKLNTYLNENWKLEIGIEEFFFTFQGKEVYRDEKPIKSLPLLFYKDGMQRLFFYKDMKKEELQEFLGVIKKIYELPIEESDIVNLMWEKDFAYIRYFAPDDFLETKIGKGPLEFKIERNEFSKGIIKLTPKDKQDLDISDLANDYFKIEEEEKKEKAKLPEPLDSDQYFLSLSEDESRTLEFMLDENRKISPEEELVLLVIEMLNLEERPQQFSETLDVLTHSHQDIIEKGDFYLAHVLLSNILEIRRLLFSQSDGKGKLIEKFLNIIKNKDSLDLIKNSLIKDKVSDLNSLFKYLKLLGPETIPFIGDLYVEIKSPDFRSRALKYLYEIGKKDITALMQIAQDDRPFLTKEVISIISSIKEERIIQHLANFIGYRNKSIKRAAIEALGKIDDITSSKILMKFLSDEDEELRALTAQNLQYLGDSSLLEQVKNLVQDKRFKKKNRTEKQALLDLLGRSKAKEACTILYKIMKKSGIFSPSGQVESSLCAVKALEIMRTPEAMETLKKGTQLRKRKINQACKHALQKLSLQGTSNTHSRGIKNGQF